MSGPWQGSRFSRPGPLGTRSLEGRGARNILKLHQSVSLYSRGFGSDPEVGLEGYCSREHGENSNYFRSICALTLASGPECLDILR